MQPIHIHNESEHGKKDNGDEVLNTIAIAQGMNKAEAFEAKIDSYLAKFVSAIAVFMGIVGIAIIVFTYVPNLWEVLWQRNAESILNLDSSNPNEHLNANYVPRFDATLPATSSITIPSIKVNGALHEASLTNYEEALRNGIWRVFNFGTPDKQDQPVILAAHRYGYTAWSNLYRRENSFYNLPKTEKGDIVTITWGQREYIYEIYDTSEGEKITDYSADLILYTCKTLSSDTRIFRYARLIRV